MKNLLPYVAALLTGIKLWPPFLLLGYLIETLVDHQLLLSASDLSFRYNESNKKNLQAAMEHFLAQIWHQDYVLLPALKSHRTQLPNIWEKYFLQYDIFKCNCYLCTYNEAYKIVILHFMFLISWFFKFA